EPVKRTVALKVLKRGMDTRAVLTLFQAERQALAMMDHPNITRILDAGATEDGLPYFVMDLIGGPKITAYCDAKRMTTRERIALLLPVCEAIEHAHQKGVIHRDIKPSNLLVPERDGAPAPQVIDFGIAKAMDAPLADGTRLTKHGNAIGTPAYMSPEQAAGRSDIDTRTDVYSLGAVLYELLSGEAPFDTHALLEGGPDRLSHALRDEDPPTPSARVATTSKTAGEIAVNRSSTAQELPVELRGELDWITMKAMAKEPGRRYGSAGALAADLRRYLAYEPVAAAPPDTAYQLRKFVRRHRTGVAVSAAALVALIAFAGVMAVQANRIAAERDRANQERASAERVANFLAEMLSTVEPRAAGESIRNDARARFEAARRESGASERELEEQLREFDSLLEPVNMTDVALHVLDRDVLARAARTIDDELTAEPAIAARLRSTLGQTYRDLGLYEQAEKHIREAIVQQTDLLGPDDETTLHSVNSLTILLQKQDRIDEAEANATDAYERTRAHLGPDSPETLSALTNLGIVLRMQNKLEEAEAARREALREHERVYGRDHKETIVALGNLAVLLNEAGHYEEAEPLLRDCAERAAALLGADHAVTTIARNNLGLLLEITGQLEEAVALKRQVLETSREIHGENHHETLAALLNFGAGLDAVDRDEEAERAYADCAARCESALGGDHFLAITALSNLGALQKDAGRYDEAEANLVAAFARSTRSRGDDHIGTINILGHLGETIRLQGRLLEAEAKLADCLTRAERAVPPEHYFLGVIVRRAALVQKDLEHYEAAERELLRAHAILEAGLGPDHAIVAEASDDLAALYDAWGRPAQSAEWR
ncbi:MAG: serine/threonine protein kinase, partial [Gemmatimonadetes bacterium]|nr:serine/threonine protein kinase [Gemmatimonadota bacterium]